MRPNPVSWFEIYVKDMARAKAFYERVLHTKLSPLEMPESAGPGEMMTFPMTDETRYGATGALVKMPDVPVGGGGVMVYFECEDCAVEASRVESSGGEIIMDKFAIGPHGFCALAKDSEGNPFGLHSMK